MGTVDIRIRRAQGARLKLARKQAGYKSGREAALERGWPESSYRSHENGTRTMGDDDADRYAAAYRALGVKVTARDILFPDMDAPDITAESRTVPIMGYVGAGAEIDPDFEQVPPEGLSNVDPLLPLPADMIGFEVVGDSMTPRYDEGDVIICYGDQRRPIEAFYGEEAAVRTAEGRRYLKRIARGPTKRTVNLESFNAKTIAGVRLEWIGEIWITLRAGQFRRLKRAKVASGR